MSACPICRDRASDPAFRPFCSKRCADIDLGRWFTGRYVVPGAEEVDDEDAPGGRDGE
ncbi:MAG: DNA gyrase inhibitor YacG [Alphaproteobacteria bacterium]|nr:DNA gyrase inhibitor YacG [Alphaproteobacteria bacterium]